MATKYDGICEIKDTWNECGEVNKLLADGWVLLDKEQQDFTICDTKGAGIGSCKRTLYTVGRKAVVNACVIV